jgi:hypothetical protein
VQLISVDIKPRPLDDGNADFFDEVPDLNPWLRDDAFKQRRVSDFYVKNVEDPNSQFPGFIRDNNTALLRKYILYYTILPSLPINKCCTRYIRLDPPRDRLFWRRDLFVIRYKGELGIGHKYIDTLLILTRIIKDIIRSVYQRRALKGIIKKDNKLERVMQRDRK